MGRGEITAESDPFVRNLQGSRACEQTLPVPTAVVHTGKNVSIGLPAVIEVVDCPPGDRNRYGGCCSSNLDHFDYAKLSTNTRIMGRKIYPKIYPSQAAAPAFQADSVGSIPITLFAVHVNDYGNSGRRENVSRVCTRARTLPKLIRDEIYSITGVIVRLLAAIHVLRSLVKPRITLKFSASGHNPTVPKSLQRNRGSVRPFPRISPVRSNAPPRLSPP